MVDPATADVLGRGALRRVATSVGRAGIRVPVALEQAAPEQVELIKGVQGLEQGVQTLEQVERERVAHPRVLAPALVRVGQVAVREVLVVAEREEPVAVELAAGEVAGRFRFLRK